MKSLAVIGSQGMLGSDLARYLGSSFRITGIHKANYEKLKGRSFDIVINANGNSKRFWANSNPKEDFFASTVSVYNTLFDFRYQSYIYISSSDIYPDHTGPKTTHELQYIDPQGFSPYGLHKYLAEIAVRTYAKSYVILRSSMILGKNLKKGPIYDILHNKPLFITKTSRLQMITSEEIARVITFLIRKNIHGEIYNVGGEKTVDFAGIHRYVEKPVSVSRGAKKQVYEMSVMKLKKLYPLKTSKEYIKQFLQEML